MSTLAEMYNGMRVVAVIQNKGGVGKTFLSTNLAVRAALGHIPEIRKGKKVLLIDVDPQQNLSSTFLRMEELPGRESKLAPLHPEYDPNNPDDVEWGGRSSSVGVYYGEDVLPYPTPLEGVDILPADGNVLSNLHAALQNIDDAQLVNAMKFRLREFFSSEDVQELYDLVIIDCPPGKGLIHIPIMRAITDVVIPCEPQPHCLDGTNQTINLINNENPNRDAAPINIVGVIPNKYDMRANDFRINLEAMRANDTWSKHVPDFEMRLLRDYRISHLPEDLDGLHRFKTDKAETSMRQFIELFRASVYGTKFEDTKKEAS